MKPKRMHMVHNMVVNYGLYKKMDIVVSSFDVIQIRLRDPTLCRNLYGQPLIK